MYKNPIFSGPSPSDVEAMYRTMLEANLSSDVAMIVLDVVSLYTQHFKVGNYFDILLGNGTIVVAGHWY